MIIDWWGELLKVAVPAAPYVMGAFGAVLVAAVGLRLGRWLARHFRPRPPAGASRKRSMLSTRPGGGLELEGLPVRPGSLLEVKMPGPYEVGTVWLSVRVSRKGGQWLLVSKDLTLDAPGQAARWPVDKPIGEEAQLMRQLRKCRRCSNRARLEFCQTGCAFWLKKQLIATDPKTPDYVRKLL